MLKKILVFWIALIIIFSFTACNLCDDSDDKLAQLTQYKITGKSLIDDHVTTKSQSDYSEENWAAILQAVIDGKAAVDTAINKDGVNNAVEMAKADWKSKRNNHI